MGEVRYNWEELKQEFFNSDFQTVMQFLRDRKFPMTTGTDGVNRLSGSSTKRVAGWAEEKKEFTRNRNAMIQSEIDKDAIEKYKITVESLIKNKSIVADLDQKFLELLVKIGIDEKELTKVEKEFMKAFGINSRAVADIAKRISLELGEPSERKELRLSGGVVHGHIDLSQENLVKITEAFSRWGIPILTAEEIKEELVDGEQITDVVPEVSGQDNEESERPEVETGTE